MVKQIKKIGFNLGMVILAIFSYEATANALFFGGSLILTQDSFENHTSMIDTILVLVLLVVYGFWLYAIFRKERRNGIGMTVNPLNKRMLLIIPILTFGLRGIVHLWFIAVEYGLNSIPWIEASMQSHIDNWSSINTQPYIWSLLSVVVLGPIVEELLFRGLVFHYLEKIRGGWFPILISGIAFGVWHGEPIQCVYAAIIGIGFGIVYARVRDLRVVILLHVLNNFLSCLPPAIDTDLVYNILAVIDFVLIIPAIVILFRMCRETPKRALCVKG